MDLSENTPRRKPRAGFAPQKKIDIENDSHSKKMIMRMRIILIGGALPDNLWISSLHNPVDNFTAGQAGLEARVVDNPTPTPVDKCARTAGGLG